jgi:predicted DNA-binding transcriptional regulator AlpA
MSLKPDNTSSSSSVEDLPDLLTAKDLERLLKIDVKTIYNYAQKGLLPYVRIQSNLRFEKSEILHWIEEHRFRPNTLGIRR